jgi:hypothetical protein
LWISNIAGFSPDIKPISDHQSRYGHRNIHSVTPWHNLTVENRERRKLGWMSAWLFEGISITFWGKRCQRESDFAIYYACHFRTGCFAPYIEDKKRKCLKRAPPKQRCLVDWSRVGK